MWRRTWIRGFSRSWGLVVFLLGFQTAGCLPQGCQPASSSRIVYTETRQACAEYHPERKAFFGDLHVHTGFSFDAWAYQSRMTALAAYRFAQGQSLELAPLDAAGKGQRTVKLARSLDFAAVTEHAEFLGEIGLCTVAGSQVYDTEICTKYRMSNETSVFQFGSRLILPMPQREPLLCGADGDLCLAMARMRWKQLKDTAEEVYDRTDKCSFVSFVGYEYTATPETSNLHRNIIFRNSSTPMLPVTYYDQDNPYGLWAALKESCQDQKNGCEALSIAHNSNLSNGRFFRTVYPKAETREAEAALARLRRDMEPLAEIFQHKGDAECRNGLFGVFGDADPFCDFEKLHPAGHDDCKDSFGSGGMRLWGCISRLDYLRNVLKAGMQEEERLGVNPFQLGFVGATDTHNGTAGLTDEDAFVGHIGTVDHTPEGRLGTGNLTHDGFINNPGGLAVLWAEEKSRDALYNAMQRRETYGTSGTRIVLRFFGGWAYPADLCAQEALAKVGYEKGVPMGGFLSSPASDAPTFVLSAQADPGLPSRPGTPLARIQIVKGWLGSDRKPYEKVYDVGGDLQSKASVDLATCQTTQSGGSRSFCAVWKDPSFDKTQRAFYYARVLEEPTCRWSTRQCLALPADKRPPPCTDPKAAKIIQERAWSSPIWYRPAP